jgi:hypothetical protein
MPFTLGEAHQILPLRIMKSILKGEELFLTSQSLAVDNYTLPNFAKAD